MSRLVADVTMEELLRPKFEGEVVNGHVIPAAIEPSQNYEAMRRLVSNPVFAAELRNDDKNPQNER